MREFWEVRENFGFGHSGGQVIEDIGHGDPHPPDAGLPAPLARLDGDDLVVVHNLMLKRKEAPSSGHSSGLLS